MASYKDHCYAWFFQHRCGNPVWRHKGRHQCRHCGNTWANREEDQEKTEASE